MKRILLAFVLLLISTSVLANDKVLNIYNWTNYMSNDVLKQFEKETGIHVNYATFTGNNSLYAKLKVDPNAGYDVIVPSSYFVARMRNQNMLHKLDKTKLTNFKNLNPSLLNKSFDPHNDYTVPYFWGTTAMVVNDRYYDPKKITRWADFWKPEFKNQLLILDDTHDVFSMALMTLGYSASDANPEHIHQAYLKLKQLLPNIKLFNADAAKATYIDEDATIGMGYSGDIYVAQQENPHLVYVYPKEGFTLWIDCLAIPKNAPHLDNAYRFINFLLRPDIAAKLSQDLGYASPNAAALKLLPPKVRNNATIYPPASTLARGQLETDPGNVDSLYEKYMELLKISA